MNGKINYISIFYEILYIIMKIWSIITPIITLLFFITCCPKNTLICKLDLVYRYTVYNEKTHLWPFYTHFAERKKGISNHSVITQLRIIFIQSLVKKKKKKIMW